MSRFEKIDGYNAIKDNETLVFTFDYEPKEYAVGEFSVEDMLSLLNSMNDEILALKGAMAYLISKLEEDE